jgi:hypothetical protein
MFMFRNIFRKQLTEVQDAWTLAHAIVDTVREPLIVLDQDLRVVAASRSFYLTFKVNADYTQGKLLYDLGDGQWDIPKLRLLLGKIVPEQGAMEDYEVEHDFPSIGRRTMLLNARKVFYEKGSHSTILVGIEDVTDKRILENEKDDLNGSGLTRSKAQCCPLIDPVGTKADPSHDTHREPVRAGFRGAEAIDGQHIPICNCYLWIPAAGRRGVDHPHAIGCCVCLRNLSSLCARSKPQQFRGTDVYRRNPLRAGQLLPSHGEPDQPLSIRSGGCDRELHGLCVPKT